MRANHGSARLRYGPFFLAIGILFSLLLTASTLHGGEWIEVTLRNFAHAKNSHGTFVYSPIVEQGIPAKEHILVVKSCRCLDDARDKQMNDYYFYMVDHSAGLKALITPAKLKPFKGLDEQVREFVQVIEEEIKKDGGIDSLIKKFKRD